MGVFPEGTIDLQINFESDFCNHLAAHGWLGQTGKQPHWEEMVAGFTDPIPGSEVRPNPEVTRVYDRLIEKYAACERRAMEQLH